MSSKFYISWCVSCICVMHLKLVFLLLVAVSFTDGAVVKVLKCRGVRLAKNDFQFGFRFSFAKSCGFRFDFAFTVLVFLVRFLHRTSMPSFIYASML